MGSQGSLRRGLIGRVPLVDAVFAGPSFDQPLPTQVSQMGECFSHCQISLKLQEGLGDLSFGDLMDGAGWLRIKA